MHLQYGIGCCPFLVSSRQCTVLRHLLMSPKKPIVRSESSYFVYKCLNQLITSHLYEYFRVVAARSVFASGVSIGLCQFLSVILYLFCAPRNEVIATLHAPQPFILIYDLSIGRGGATFMAVLSTLNQIFVRIRFLCISCENNPC